MSRRKQSNPRSLRVNGDSELPPPDTDLPSGLVSDSPPPLVISLKPDPDLNQPSSITLSQLLSNDDSHFVCDNCGLTLSSLSEFTNHKENGCSLNQSTINDVHNNNILDNNVAQNLTKPKEGVHSPPLNAVPPSSSPFRTDTDSPVRKEGSPSVAVIQLDGREISEEDLYGGRGWELSFDRLPTVMPNSQGLFECGLCKETFAKLTHLLEHEQNHPDYLPFKCKYCQRQFRHKRSLIRHVRLHLGDRRYKCDFCGMAFVRSDHLKNHKRTHSQCNKPQDDPRNGSTVVTDSQTEQKVNEAMRHSLMEMLERDKAKKTPSIGIMGMDVGQRFAAPLITSNGPLKRPVMGLVSVAQPYLQHQHGRAPLVIQPQPAPELLKRTTVKPEPTTSPKRLKLSYSPPDEYPHLDSHLRDWVHTRRQDGIEVNLAIFDSYAQHKFSEFYLRSPAPKDWILDLARQLDVKAPVEVPKVNGNDGSQSAEVERCPSRSSSLNLNVKGDSPSGAVYSCPECSQEFSTEECLETHLSEHLLKISTEYGCNSCLKLFATPDDLQKHLIDLHAHHIFRCSLCNRSFEAKPEIQIHFSIEHSEQCRVFTCKACSMVFHSERQWQLHLKVAHMGTVKPFRCLLCTSSFSSDSELQQHAASHQKTYQCHFCSEAFHVEYLLDKHVQSAHQPHKGDAPLTPPVISHFKPSTTQTIPKEKSRANYNCDRCSASFPNYQMYKGHYVHKHGLKPKLSPLGRKESVEVLNLAAWEMCFLCLRSYRTRCELEKHLNTHFPVGRLKCNICDTEFPSFKLLSEHRLSHCKLASSNTCIVCKTVLTSKADFIKHVNDHGRREVSNMHCVLCQQSLASTIDLEVHSDYHFNDAITKYTCKLCINDFTDPSSVEFFMEDGAAFYLCKTCRVHKNTKCSECGTKALNTVDFVFSTDRQSGSCRKCLPKKKSLPVGERCVACGRNFVSKTDLCEKMSSKDVPYYLCRMCLGEIEKVPSSDETRTCFLCSYTFTSDDHLVATFDSSGRLCTLCRGCFSGSFNCSKCSRAHISMNKMNLETGSDGLKSSVCVDCNADNGGKFACPQCDGKFDTQAGLDTHATTHKAFQCLKCEAVFQSEGEIEQHVAIHLADDNCDNVCNLCDAGHSSPSKLKTHLIDHSFPDRKYSCPNCVLILDDGAALQAHVADKHGSETGKHACDSCEKTFHFSAELDHHVIAAHSNESDDIEAKLDELDIPRASSSDSKAKISCPLCQLSFDGASGFQVHFFASHSNLDLTTLPLKGDSASKSPMDDLNVTPGSDSGDEYLTRRFPCSLCGKRFKRKAHLRRHMNVHSRMSHRMTPVQSLKKEKFRCRVCGVEYNQMKNLRRHMHVYHETGLTQIPRQTDGRRNITQPILPQTSNDDGEPMGKEAENESTASVEKGNATSPSSHSSTAVDSGAKDESDKDMPSSSSSGSPEHQPPEIDIPKACKLQKSPIRPVPVEFPANVSLPLPLSS